MRKSRLSRGKQELLLAHFVAGATARTAAALVGVNKSTAAFYFHRLRQLIHQATEEQTPFAGEIEVGECARRVEIRVGVETLHEVVGLIAEIALHFEFRLRQHVTHIVGRLQPLA